MDKNEKYKATAHGDILTMLGMERKPKTAMEVYEFIGLWKLSRIHRALCLLEHTGKIISNRAGHCKVYKLA